MRFKSTESAVAHGECLRVLLLMEVRYDWSRYVLLDLCGPASRLR